MLKAGGGTVGSNVWGLTDGESTVEVGVGEGWRSPGVLEVTAVMLAEWATMFWMACSSWLSPMLATAMGGGWGVAPELELGVPAPWLVCGGWGPGGGSGGNFIISRGLGAACKTRHYDRKVVHYTSSLLLIWKHYTTFSFQTMFSYICSFGINARVFVMDEDRALLQEQLYT